MARVVGMVAPAQLLFSTQQHSTSTAPLHAPLAGECCIFVRVLDRENDRFSHHIPHSAQLMLHSAAACSGRIVIANLPQSQYRSILEIVFFGGIIIAQTSNRDIQHFNCSSKTNFSPAGARPCSKWSPGSGLELLEIELQIPPRSARLLTLLSKSFRLPTQEPACS